jgi:hypothetical protein
MKQGGIFLHKYFSSKIAIRAACYAFFMHGLSPGSCEAASSIVGGFGSLVDQLGKVADKFVQAQGKVNESALKVAQQKIDKEKQEKALEDQKAKLHSQGQRPPPPWGPPGPPSHPVGWGPGPGQEHMAPADYARLSADQAPNPGQPNYPGYGQKHQAGGGYPAAGYGGQNPQPQYQQGPPNPAYGPPGGGGYVPTGPQGAGRTPMGGPQGAWQQPQPAQPQYPPGQGQPGYPVQRPRSNSSPPQAAYVASALTRGPGGWNSGQAQPVTTGRRR